MHGDSLRRQLALTTAFCDRNGLILDDSLSLRDLGVSGFRGTNADTGALSIFLSAIKDGTVKPGSVLVLENLDRLTRDEISEALTLFLGILKADVEIATVSPEQIYTRKTINDLPTILTAILSLNLGHGESAKKSARLTEAWIGKRKKIDERKLTARCPAWLILSADKTTWAIRQESAKLVRQIFRWSAEGLGIGTICGRLNRMRVHNFGNRSKTGWHKSYVLKILRSRAVLGEYQPHTGHNSSRKPLGEPIEGYYPAIVSEAEFYAAQEALDSRNRTGGRTGNGVSTLFTGLLRDARDGQTMNMVNKGKRGARHIVSSGALRKVPGSVYISVRYDSFESAFLQFITELKPSQVAPKRQRSHEKTEHLTGRLKELLTKIATVKARITAEPDVEILLDVLADLDHERKEVAAALERAKALAAHNERDALKDTLTLASMMVAATGQEREDLRRKVRQLIRHLISEIWMLPHLVEDVEGSKPIRYTQCEVYFKSGAVHRFSIYGTELKDGVSCPVPIQHHELRYWRYCEALER